MVQSSSPGAAGGAPEADQPGSVRNVVLVGHSGAGKTTLVEALLAAAGTVNRAGRVEDGTTVTDFDEIEHRQQRSISLALAPLVHAGRQGQPAGHPRVRGLRRRPAGRSARGRRGPVRGLGGRRRRRRHRRCSGRSARRSACRAPSSSRSWTRPAPTSTRWSAICQRVFGDGRPAPLPAAAPPTTAPRAGADRPARPAGLRLLLRHQRGARPGPAAPAVDRRPPATRSSRGSSPRARTRR